ncbi:MAG: hypothetical protein L0H63_05790 [Nitrococcus sp.]|nr:hypothetical protein [Nitrococcus sp.]
MLCILPQPLQSAGTLLPGAELLEIALDLGRRPQARLTYAAIDLADEPVTRLDLQRIISALGPFTADNRVGIEGTLHRVAAIRNRLVRIYPYAISRDLVEKVIRDLRLNARTVPRAEQADLALALRARAADPRLRRLLEATSITLHQVNRNSTAQIRHALRDLFNVLLGLEEEAVDEAAREAEHAAQRVLAQGIAVELAPRPAPIRKMQHRIAMRHRLHAQSTGSEPQRHLVLHPGTEGSFGE